MANIASALMSVDAIVTTETKTKQTQVSSLTIDLLLFVRIEFFIVFLPFNFLHDVI
jgi:hypothetical protein